MHTRQGRGRGRVEGVVGSAVPYLDWPWIAAFMQELQV